MVLIQTLLFERDNRIYLDKNDLLLWLKEIEEDDVANKLQEKMCPLFEQMEEVQKKQKHI
jgi:hypothetical protein